MAQIFARRTSDGHWKAVECTDDGKLKIASDLTLEPTNLATSAKQDTGNGSLATLAATVAGTVTKRVVVILCGTQLDGTVTPLLCDADGKLVVTS
jgi:hypothetical protein